VRILDAGDDFGGLFLVVGIVVVVTLVTLPFIGRFFAAALAGGGLVAIGLWAWRRRRGGRTW
jgi:hypothetical protein